MDKRDFKAFMYDIRLVCADIILSKIERKLNFNKKDYQTLELLLNDYIRLKEEKIYGCKKHE